MGSGKGGEGKGKGKEEEKGERWGKGRWRIALRGDRRPWMSQHPGPRTSTDRSAVGPEESHMHLQCVKSGYH